MLIFTLIRTCSIRGGSWRRNSSDPNAAGDASPAHVDVERCVLLGDGACLLASACPRCLDIVDVVSERLKIPEQLSEI